MKRKNKNKKKNEDVDGYSYYFRIKSHKGQKSTFRKCNKWVSW